MVNKTVQPRTRRATNTKKSTKRKKVNKSSGANSSKSISKQVQSSPFVTWLKQFIYLLLWNRFTKSALACGIALLLIYGAYCAFIRPYSYRWMPCYGNKSYGICVPYKYEVHGLDVSRHQGNIDWDTLVANIDENAPLNFVFMKATEGGDFNDINFKANFESAKKVNLIRGAYHFFSPHTSAQAQAKHYIKQVKLQKGDLPPVLDVEVLGRHTKSSISDSVLVWLDIVEKHYKVKPILYTSFKFKNRYLNDIKFNVYPFWIAHYYVGKLRYTGTWSFWQHTDIGRVPGINKDVDLNVFNGTIEELRAMTIH